MCTKDFQLKGHSTLSVFTGRVYARAVNTSVILDIRVYAGPYSRASHMHLFTICEHGPSRMPVLWVVWTCRRP